MKVNELTGAALDWAVIESNGWGADYKRFGFSLGDCDSTYTPSTNWAQGGPIIERERIRIDCPWNPGPFEAECKIDGVTAWTNGPTVLVAAMRCYVASKLGDEIDLPKELT